MLTAGGMIGLLLYNTRHFTIEGFRMEETQTWAISVENGCAYGRIADIDFLNTRKYPNQDGVDVRKGCHDIIIENITGTTGDDSVAITGLCADNWDPKQPAMQLVTRHTGHDDIYNVIIHNVKTRTLGTCHTVRLLNHDGVKLYNVFIRDVMDVSGPDDPRPQAAVKIGDADYSSMTKNKLGETYNIFVTMSYLAPRRS